MTTAVQSIAIALSDAVGLSELRKRLFDFVAEVSNDPLAIVPIKRRTDVSALLVSYERFGPLLEAISGSHGHEASLRQLLLWMIIERWLQKAPAHLREAQRKEISGLSIEQLQTLFVSDPARTRAADLARAGIDSKVAERLVKRQQLTRSIAKAEADGLYDAVDHKSSEAV